MPVTIETDTPHLVFVRSVGHATIEEIDRYFEARYQDFGLTEPYSQVIDANSFAGMSFAERHHFAAELRKVEKNYGTLHRGVAVVLQSAALRGLIRAIQWSAPPVTPVKFFKDIAEATQWALQLVEDSSTAPNASVPAADDPTRPPRTLSKAFRTPKQSP